MIRAPSRAKPVAAARGEDPFEIAVEHAAWCIRRGMTLQEVFDCLALPRRTPTLLPLPPRGVTWNDAILAIARAYESLEDGPGRRLAA